MFFLPTFSQLPTVHFLMFWGFEGIFHLLALVAEIFATKASNKKLFEIRKKHKTC